MYEASNLIFLVDLIESSITNHIDSTLWNEVNNEIENERAEVEKMIQIEK